MNRIVLYGLLLLSFSTVAQQTPYQSFDVDSVAQPRGGLAALNTFLQVNLQKPITAQAVGVGGIVVLTGIVETDGHVSTIQVSKSLRPDCDREAMRVFNLFRAWKPAYKQGKVVRQQVSMPIVFKPNRPVRYEQGKQITYLDADVNVLPDSNDRVKFKEINPIDTTGLPTGDLVLYKLINGKWDEYARDSLVRTKKEQADPAHQTTYFVGHQLALQKLKGFLYTVNARGNQLSESYYERGKLTGTQLLYHENGAVAEKIEHNDPKQTIVAWYANGQIQQVHELTHNSPLEPSFIDKVTAFWDSTGRQSVKEGNGRAIYNRVVQSKNNSGLATTLIEQGDYRNSLKQGTWTGHYADGSFFYEERYEQGVLLAGKSGVTDQDATAYVLEDRPPVFPGGLQGLSQFLKENLRYPAGAQQARAEGQVLLRFVVCEDGTLCDYEITKGVQQDIDREALRVVKKMSGLWIPGIREGKKVRVKYNMPINFSLY